ncbi:ribosome-associated translation inhibitor RaiA [Agromyces sp. MMS17-SY077]|uniref:Ribosome hibernation promoting factor n=2 Tax=Agromyces seonyuensis TaxID=2662446 RepID=A0A6I4P8E6_9MICO|nr:ribosome-associated translation inhibitor RaiA [Agromyces seonyuensis]MWC00325.1 ribosome-associated translation inhibitor RaiA [Agromyces seonyuensis]
MELHIVGRNLEVTDRFRDYVEEKAEKIGSLDGKADTLHIKATRHNERNNAAVPDRVELTLVGKGPVIRAESDGVDKYAAFDAALARLLEQCRRAKDRRKAHRPHHGSVSLGRQAESGFADVAVQAATVEVLEQVRTGSIPAIDELETDETDEYSPVVIRQKVFAATPMSVDDALYYMELVGHDFYLFVDAETARPSVVYRRKGWDYGVIGLDTTPAAD